MNQTIFHITCSTDDNYAQHCCVMLCSLLDNNKEQSFYIHIITKELSDENIQRIIQVISAFNAQIRFYQIDGQKLNGVRYRINRPLSEAAYYRVLLASILDKSIEKVLYFDCDMIIRCSVAELFKIELDNYGVAAVEDIGFPHNDLHRIQLSIPYKGRYFCSGMMLINLKYWREHEVESKLIEYSKRERFVFLHDQDSLNYVFKNCWYALPPKWNRFNMSYIGKEYFDTYMDYCEWRDNPCVIHYVNVAKPWLQIKHVEFQGEYIKYLNMTPWKGVEFPFPEDKIACEKLIYHYYESKFLSKFPKLFQIVFVKIRSLFYK